MDNKYNLSSMEKISLSSHFTYKSILRLCLAPMLMMIFTSLYTVIDGLFVSNYAGLDAFAGMNLIAPLTMIVGGLGFMFGSGGSALASKYLGEKRHEEANKVLAMMIEVSIVLVVIVSAILFPFVDDIARSLASLADDCTEEAIRNATIYGRVLLGGQFIFCMQVLYHNFFIVNETPKAGFIQTILAGAANIVFDAIFIVGFKMGVLGAAIGTIIGYAVGAAYSFIYMYKGKHNALKITWCKPDVHTVMKCSINGSSDFIFNISSAVVSLVYNIQLLKYFGQTGVNAYGAIMYINFIFVAIFIGIAIGTAPVIGYNLGAKNHKELHNVIYKTLNIVFVLSIILTAIAEASATLLANAFTKDPVTNDLTVKAIRLYSFCFLFAGFGIFITSMFTGLNNGFISGLLSLVRTLILQIILLIVLPLIFGRDSLWWNIIIVEGLSAILSFILFFAKKKIYHY